MKKVKLYKCVCGTTKRPILSYMMDEHGIAYDVEVYCSSCEKSTEPHIDGYIAAGTLGGLLKRLKPYVKWLQSRTSKEKL